jgi:hypothetical protein
MQYPTTLQLSYLELKHSCYEELSEVWERILHLTEGGYLLEANKEKYLPQRCGEEDFIYAQRIKKFTYRNLLGSLIQQQSSKLSTGSYSVTGTDGNSKFWTEFKENVDLKGTEEFDFLTKLFRQALKYQTIYIHVDKPKSQIKPLNKQQEELLNLRPYLVLYSAPDVYDWQEDELDNLTFLKLRQISEYRETAFSKPRSKITWTIITSDAILRYSALVKLSATNQITHIIAPNGDEIPVSDELEIPLESEPIFHGMSTFPVERFQLPSDLWVANQVYLKCLEHLSLDNIKYDAASLATYIQRVIKPYILKTDEVNDIPDQTPPQSGNPYIMKADSFEFAEMQGTALTVVSAILKELEQEIKDIISLGVASSTKEAVEQSGISKKLDLYREELCLRAYGKLILDCYQNILQKVAISQGMNPDLIFTTGFDSFSLDSLDDSLLVAEALMKISKLIPPSAFKLFTQQLVSQLIPNASAEQKQLLMDEIENIDFEAINTSPIPPSPDTSATGSAR